ncbi:MAG TPA: histidine--tRNA ligase [Firmicutes bacterium]|jgi:histidyl-tRNA synthetase|nr:histidine--tRNA ligase [Bacillota bacterium]
MALTTSPRGTADIFGSNLETWLKLEGYIRDICRTYGYQELRTPIFEHTELFQRGIGETTDIVEKEMYTFTDRGGRSITLRPEGTAPVVRAFLEHNMGQGPLPVKLFYLGPMFRYERPQAGRYRQFHQFGLEVLGSADPLLDVETILLPVELYKTCGLEGFVVELNSIGCPECRPRYRDELKEYIRPHIGEMCSSCQARFERNPMRLLDCKNEGCRKVLAGAPVITDYLCPGCAEHFAQVRSYLDVLEVEYVLNPKLVRGFDYYTRTVFEVTFAGLGAQNAIGAGGRYDGLIEEVGGSPTPAVGFAVGVERLLLALESEGSFAPEARRPDAFIVQFGGETKVRAAKLMYELRRAGLHAEMDHLSRSVRAQMKAANRLNARWVLILGEEELLAGQAKLKDMDRGTEELVDLAVVRQHIQVGEE